MSRDPIGERGGLNLYGFVVNTPANAIDLLGLAKRTVRYVGKSFINGVGPLGSLGNRLGLPVIGSVHILGLNYGGGPEDPEQADTRLAFLASQVGSLAAFNENPLTAAKDGRYRLYGEVEITARCCGSILVGFSTSSDNDGGSEIGPLSGTSNIDVTKSGAFNPFQGWVEWTTWGRPNLLVEPGMQWVALRTSVNIWHEGKVTITCSGGDPIFTVLGFRGSSYPSRRLWEDGVLIRDEVQGSFSDLWQAQPGSPTMVAE